MTQLKAGNIKLLDKVISINTVKLNCGGFVEEGVFHTYNAKVIALKACKEALALVYLKDQFFR